MAANRLPLISTLARVCLVFTAALLAGCPAAPDGPDAPLPTQTLQINGQPLTAELALNGDTRLRGLSGRASLAPDHGMLFVFPREQKLAFVMRECLMPIDIAFIDAAGLVVKTHAMTLDPPGTTEKDLTQYPSGKPALFALELAAGGLERYELTPGVQLDLPVLELKRRAR